MDENWLAERGQDLRTGIQIATLDPFHIVKLADDAPGAVCRRVQQDTTGHCGRKDDPSTRSAILCAPYTQAHPTVTFHVLCSPGLGPKIFSLSATHGRYHPRDIDARVAELA